MATTNKDLAKFVVIQDKDGVFVSDMDDFCRGDYDVGATIHYFSLQLPPIKRETTKFIPLGVIKK